MLSSNACVEQVWHQADGMVLLAHLTCGERHKAESLTLPCSLVAREVYVDNLHIEDGLKLE